MQRRVVGVEQQLATAARRSASAEQRDRGRRCDERPAVAVRASARRRVGVLVVEPEAHERLAEPEAQQDRREDDDVSSVSA